MAGQLEARVVITAQDETGKAFTSLKERIASIEKIVGPLNKSIAAVGPAMKSVESFKLPAALPAEMTKMVGTISSVDRVMRDVGKSSVGVAGNIGKASAEVVQLSGRLMDAGSKLKAIGDFRLSAKGVKDTSLALQKAEQDARALAAKIDGVPSPARSMVAAHAGALAEVRETERALERQTATAAAARTALAELGVPLSRLRDEETQLRSAIAGTNDALLRQIQLEREGAAAAEKAAQAQRLSAEQERRHHDALVQRFAAEDHARHAAGAAHGGGEHAGHGFVNYALTSAAMAVSAHEIGHVIGEAIHEGAELQHERIQLTNAGRTPEEMREIEAAGRSTISALPTANFTETMKVVAETTGAFGSVHHALDNLDFMMKSMSVLKSAGGDKIQGDAGEVGRYFAKTFEERQTRPEDFQKEASAMIPAMVASGGVFNPQELYAFAQQAKSSLPNYDIRFLSKIAPSIVTELGGNRAGTAANAFTSVIMGKVNDKKQAEAFLHAGLLDPSKAIMKAGHAVGWQAGAIKDTNLALTDPLRWIEEVQNPALAKMGVAVADRLELTKALGTMYRNQNANLFANTLSQQASQARLHKDEALYNKTGNLDELYTANLGDFHVGAEALAESLKTLAAATTAPMMHQTGQALSWLAGELNQVSAAALRHPTMAATAGVGAAAAALGSAGWLGMKLMNGFGLKGSAVALDASAASLEAAAVRLGAGGVGGAAGAAGKVATGAGVAGALDGAPAALAIPGAVELGAAAGAGLLAVGAVGLVKAAFDAQEPGMGGQWSPATAATRADDVQRMEDQQEEADRLRAEIDRNKRMEKIPGTSDVLNENLQRQLDDKLAQVENTRRSIAAVDAAASHEARVGRAMMAMPKPEQAGPEIPPELRDRYAYVDREAERGRGYGGLRKPEMFGPEREAQGPALPGDDAARLRYANAETERSRALAPPPMHVEDGYPGVDRRTFGSYLHQMGPLAAEGVMPAPRPPTASAAPPLPTLPSGGIPVHIVGSTVEHMPTGPLGPGLHRDFTLGNNSGGFDSLGFGAGGGFDPGPRRGPNLDVLNAHPVELHADDSALVALDAKLTEVEQHAQTLGATPIAVKADSASVEALIGLLTRAISLKAQLGGMPAGGAGGSGGSLGTSYPATAPAGRQGGPR